MTNRIDFKVEGTEKAIANLRKYSLVKRQACKTVLKEEGFKIETGAKRDCPVQYGRLRASLSTNWSGSGMDSGKAGSQAKSGDGVGQPEGPPGLVVVVGTKVKYAHIQEFGTWGSGPKPGPGESLPKRKHEPTPRPEGGFQFLTRAYLSGKNNVEKRLAAVLKEDVK